MIFVNWLDYADKIIHHFYLLWLFGLYRFARRRSLSWIMHLMMTNLPSLSLCLFSILYSRTSLKQISVPLASLTPWENSISPRHWDFQMLSEFSSEWVSCKKTILSWEVCFLIHLKTIFLFSKWRRPLTFKERTSKLNSLLLVSKIVPILHFVYQYLVLLPD